MNLKKLTDGLSVGAQLQLGDMAVLADNGFRSVVCNRPDGEASDQPGHAEMAAAASKAGLQFRYIPVTPGIVTEETAEDFRKALIDLPGPVAGYCRSGTRTTTLWSLAMAKSMPVVDILQATRAAGYDMSGVARRIANGGKTPTDVADAEYDVVIVGAGAGGIAAASSIKARRSSVDIAIIDPADVHYYQPGWTMVGGGVFDAKTTARTMASLIPAGVHWLKSAVAAFEPANNVVILDGCRVVKYKRLIVAPGLKLDWDAIPGLTDTLGANGVTSNYRYDLAPYTWKLVQGLTSGRAIFTQPPMPIKCAGAPQKAMYLSSDHWLRSGVLDNIDVQFNNAGGVLFGVPDYVPALESYIRKYRVTTNYFHTLVAIDGPGKTATFKVSNPDSPPREVTTSFDMIHVVPPQTAPDFIRVSPLADQAGWVDVDQHTLRHKEFDNIWSLGDVMNAPNAKTAAAARMQAPVVAANVVADIDGKGPALRYNGYGSCPLTVERGKIVLAEFGYGGALMPSFPKWVIDGTKPSRAAWLLKEQILPPVYWKAMLKGREWMAKPENVTAEAAE